MILHRFCSQREFDAYMRGETLRNDKDHGAVRGYDASTAVGFCFFTDDPKDAVHRLSGIVDLDQCITVEAPHTAVYLCHGRYPNWVRPGIQEGTTRITEFCTHHYNREQFRLISHTSEFSTYAPNASGLRYLFPEIFL